MTTTAIVVGLGVGAAHAGTPIDSTQPYYLQSNVGTTVNPDFQGGTLRDNQNNATDSNNYTVGNFSTNTIDAFGNHTTFTGNFSGLGSLTITDSQQSGGAVVVTGASEVNGTVTIDHGATLEWGNGNGNAAALAGNGAAVVNNGALMINFGGGALTGGPIAISGSGSLVVQSGRLGTTGVSTYTGSTTIAANSTLMLQGAGSIAASSGVIDNGNFDISWTSAGASIKRLSGAGSVKLGSQTLTLTNAGSTFSGVISDGGGAGGTGGGLTVGGGTQILTGTNTYTGATTIGAGATLQLGNGGTTGSVAGAIVDNGLLKFNYGGTVTSGNKISGSGSVKIAAGTVVVTNTSTINGTVTIDNGATMQWGNGTGQASYLVGGGNAVVNNGALVMNFGGGGIGGSMPISGSGSVLIQSGFFNESGLSTYTGTTTISGGTLAIASTGGITSDVTNNATFTNAGAVAGSVTNNAVATFTQTGGNVSGGVINAGTVNANGGALNGAIANNTGGSFNVGGTVTSDSTFGNANGATLAVSGGGAYTLAGLLTNNGVVTVAPGGALTANGGISNATSGVFTNNGTVTDDLNNAGLYTNNATQNANVASNTGTIVNSLGATWNGNFSTTGIVSNAGTINGGLTQTAGTTTNNGAITGPVTISGGLFAGAGSSGALTVGNGATFQPGSGVAGTGATVNGTLTLQPGSSYAVNVSPATASFTKVNGTATLAGAVNAIYAPGSYISRKYTILTATGGVNGTFSGLVNTNLPSNFHDSLNYDTNAAYLDLALTFSVPGGLNRNQQSVANALTNYFNTTGGIPLAFGALSPAGLTQASGELATGVQRTSFDAMSQFLGVMTDPTIAGWGVCDTASARGRPQSTPNPGCDVNRWTVWGGAYGISRSTNGNPTAGSNDVSSQIGGLAAGANYRFSPDTLTGFALGGGATGFSLGNGLGSGRSDLFQAGAFVHHTFGPAYLTGALAYGWQDITTDRTVGGQQHSHFNANALSGRLESGWRFDAPGEIGLTPYVAGQFTSLFLPGYGEWAQTGASTFSLDYAAKTVTDWRSEIGLRADKSIDLQDGVLTLGGRLAWAHSFDPAPSAMAKFQALPGASFTVVGASISHDAALASVSAEMKWRNGWALGASFDGAFSGVSQTYGGKATLRYQW